MMSEVSTGYRTLPEETGKLLATEESIRLGFEMLDLSWGGEGYKKDLTSKISWPLPSRVSRDAAHAETRQTESLAPVHSGRIQAVQ